MVFIERVVNKYIHNDNLDDIDKLEFEYDQLYSHALELKSNPANPEYLKIKQELKVNRQNRERMLTG